MAGFLRKRSPYRSGTIAALDVGSSKVSCAIARTNSKGALEILGVGKQLSSGVKSGVIIDMEGVVTSIVNAVHTAEKMADLTIQDIIISVNGAHLKSTNFIVEIKLSGRSIQEEDIRRALLQAKLEREDPEHQIIHMGPTGYTLDGARGIRDPRGMVGDRLKIYVHTLLSNESSLKNLTTCVARSHLEVIGHVASPYAAGLSCLVEDEIEMGVILIDMGGSTTSFAIFQEGQLRHTECLPIGGSHVTMDIARAFSTTLSYAERLKTLYGSAMGSVSDDREMIKVPLVGENRSEGTSQVTRASLVAVIKPRLEETFEIIRGRLIKIGADALQGRRVVLTGGASQLAGVRELATMVLGKNIRLGRPLNLTSQELSQDPSFATCAGLLAYGQAERLAYINNLSRDQPRNILGQVTKVLKKIW